MKYRLLIRRPAKNDLRHAARWYEGQSAGLGRELVAEVEAALNRIVENLLQYQTIYRGVRRTVPHKFPYGVFYRAEQDNIVVFELCTCIVTRRPIPR